MSLQGQKYNELARAKAMSCKGKSNEPAGAKAMSLQGPKPYEPVQVAKEMSLYGHLQT